MAEGDRAGLQMRKLAATLARALLLLVVTMIAVAAVTLAVIETDWGKDRERDVAFDVVCRSEAARSR